MVGAGEMRSWRKRRKTEFGMCRCVCVRARVRALVRVCIYLHAYIMYQLCARARACVCRYQLVCIYISVLRYAPCGHGMHICST